MPGFHVGCLLSLWCVTQMQSEWDTSERVRGWLLLMSGPFCLFEMGVKEVSRPFVEPCCGLGFIGMLLLFAHPIRPSLITAVWTILGFLLWFLASFVSVRAAVWGA